MIRIRQHLSTCLSFLVNKSLHRPVLGTTQLVRHCLLCLQPISTRRGNDNVTAVRPALNTRVPFLSEICSACFTDLPWNTSYCSACALPVSTEAQSRCGECLKHDPSFDRIICPFVYEFPIDRLIKDFKYQGKRFYGQTLWQSMALHVSHSREEPQRPAPMAIIPVPQDPLRAKGRPYNHTLRLASELAHESRLPVLKSALVKTKSSKAQVGLCKQERLQNLKHCFHAHGDIPKEVVLVDDVVTSGATAEVLSKLLKANGAEYVEVWAIARTPKPQMPR